MAMSIFPMAKARCSSFECSHSPSNQRTAGSYLATSSLSWFVAKSM